MQSAGAVQMRRLRLAVRQRPPAPSATMVAAGTTGPRLAHNLLIIKQTMRYFLEAMRSWDTREFNPASDTNVMSNRASRRSHGWRTLAAGQHTTG